MEVAQDVFVVRVSQSYRGDNRGADIAVDHTTQDDAAVLEVARLFGADAGDAVILTKPIGSGLLMTGRKLGMTDS